METNRKNFFNSTRIAVIALFSALSGILYIFGFSISVAFPSFLELNFSDIPALIGTFTLGPVSGAVIIFVKIVIKLIFKPTSTAFVGELADLLIGIAFVVPSGLIYKKRRTLRGALLAMLAGTVASVVVAVIANRLILVPFYVQFFFGGSWDPLIGMMTPLFPSCTQETFYNFYLWASVVPFNVMRCLIAVLVTFLVYKHISRAINRLNEKLTPKTNCTQEEVQRRNLSAILIGIALLLVLILIMLIVFAFSL